MSQLFDLHAHPGLKTFYVPWLTATLPTLVFLGLGVWLLRRYSLLLASPEGARHEAPETAATSA